MLERFSIKNNLSERQKSKLLVFTGCVCAALAIFLFISLTSFLFTWPADQSLIDHPDAGTLEVEAENWAGKLGFYCANFLMVEYFGLGAFVFAFYLASLVVKCFKKDNDFSIIKALLASVSGAFLFSVLFAFISDGIGGANLIVNGLGGGCGLAMKMWMVNLLGSVVSLVILLLWLFAWMFYVSPSFVHGMLSKRDQRSNLDQQFEPQTPVQQQSMQNQSMTQSPAQQSPVQQSPAQQSQAQPIMQQPVQQAQQTMQQPVQYSEQSGQRAMQRPSTQPQSAQYQSASQQEHMQSQSASQQPMYPSHTQSPAQPQIQQSGAEDSTAQQKEGGFEVIKPEGLSTEVKKDLPRIDMRDELPQYHFPGLDILGNYESKRQEVSSAELDRNNNLIRSTLKDYNIDIDDVKAVVGPTVTLYKVYPAAGVKIRSIKNRQEDIAMSLNAGKEGVRIITLNDCVGVEVPNDKASMVPLKGLLNSEEFRTVGAKSELPVAIGTTVTQKVRVFDLADAPHLLVAGATKMGKSVGLNVIIASLLYAKHPSELKFVFIDPKMVEFTAYERLLKHYLAVLPDAGSENEERQKAIVKNPKDAEKVLLALCKEMDERYELFSSTYMNNIKLYNEKFLQRKLSPTKGHHYMPYLVIVVDEYADLTMSVGSGGDAKKVARNISDSIVRLAQKGRAAGIHVILATQRPSVDVVTGLIKTNFPMRIAYKTSSPVDSRTILDTTGAEKLIGNGDMLLKAGVEMERIQCGFISNSEVNQLTLTIGEQQGYGKSFNIPYYLPDVAEETGESGMINMTELDDNFEDAARQVVMSQKGSTSDLQRRLGMGYSRAGRVMDQLEGAGIVGPQEGSKPREVLVSNFDELQVILDAFLNK